MRIVAKSLLWVLFWAWPLAIVTCFSRSFEILSVIRSTNHKQASKRPWKRHSHQSHQIWVDCCDLWPFRVFGDGRLGRHIDLHVTSWTRIFYGLNAFIVPINIGRYTKIIKFELIFTADHFGGATVHFETNALNDPKMALNTARSSVSHIRINNIHELQISLCFALRPTVFQI